MSRYDALTATLLARSEPTVTLSFDELDTIVGGLPNSAKTYSAWWVNKRSSQPHAKAWLDANRRALPDFRARHTVFVIDEAVRSPDAQDTPEADEGHQVLAEYVESTISLERDLEDHLVNHIESLEPGLSLV